MKRRTRRFILGLCGLLGGLGLLLAPAPSWALSGFQRVLVFADTIGSTTQLRLVGALALESGDPTPPQGLAALDVTGPTGTVYDLLNSQANSSAVFNPPDIFVLDVAFPDGNGDGLPDIPLGDYRVRVRTTGGAEFLATKRLTRVTRLAIPARLAPANNARVATTPTFQWGTVPGGVTYQVRIFRSRESFVDPAVSPTAPRLNIDATDVFTSPSLTGTSFTLPPGVLSPGRAYYWDVRVIDAASLQAADNLTRNDGRDAKFAFAVVGPYAEIRLNQSTLTIGDVLSASLLVINTAAIPTRVGLKIWFGLPTGTVIPFTTVPDVTLPPGRTFKVPFLDLTFLATFPRGTYSTGVQLYDPDTGLRIGNERVGQFTFSSP